MIHSIEPVVFVPKAHAVEHVRHIVAKDGGQHVFVGFAIVVLRYLVEEAFENDYFASSSSKRVNNCGI